MQVKQVQTKQDSKSKVRMFFLDNLRIFLTILVILHHTAIAYGGAGDWMIKDPMVDEISPIFLTFFNAINQSFFMSVFFILAGYFTPHSLEKKGIKQFLVDRLIRLGIPLLVYTTLIVNLNYYIIDVIGKGEAFQWHFEYNAGHLWFLQALFLFAVIYIVYWAIWGRQDQNPTAYAQNAFPSNRILAVSIVILALLTFMVRLVFPVGEWLFYFQFAHFVHYIFAFFVGVLAYRGRWLMHLSFEKAKRWGWVALATIPIFFPLLIFGGALESDAAVAKFLGGFHWQSLAYVIWETILFIAISVFLIAFFHDKLNRANSVIKWMAVNVFAVYIVHQTVLYVFQIQFLPIAIPTIVKFFIVSLITVPICFLLSQLIRQIPYAKRVLG